MFFLRKEDVSDFQDRCVVSIFLNYNPKIRLTEYIGKNHFIGYSEMYGETHFYLFNTPKNDAPQGVVFRSRNTTSKNGFRYEVFGDDFIQEYRVFADNPFRYIKEHFVKEEWEYRYEGLFVSKPPKGEAIGELYKYKSNPDETNADSLRIFDDFRSGQLTFVNPSTCNDPFDCECEIPLHDAIPVIVYKAMLKTRYSSAPAKVIPLAKISKVTDEFFKVHGDVFEGKKEEFEELVALIYSEEYISAYIDDVVNHCVSMATQVLNLKDDFRILCLARNPKDILMWGYYGNSGKGICCGHMPNVIQEGIQKRHSNICIYGDINYPDTNDRPQFHANSHDLADDIWNFIVECTFTKYHNWKHEKEFRYLLVGEEFTSNYVTITSTVDEIYLGCKSDEVDIYKVTTFSPSPHILRMHPKKYELI